MKEYVDGICNPDLVSIETAYKYLDTLVKPPKSLGRLEDIAAKIAGISGKVKNRIDKKLHVVFGADNGIYEENIASAPQNFTNLLMGYYASGQSCGINVLCKFANADLRVVDVGVKGSIDAPDIINLKLMDGTRNFAIEPAMDRETAERAISVGIDQAKFARDNGYGIIGTGEVGIGNTSTSSACAMVLLGMSADEAVGRGAGLSDEAFSRKKEVISRAVKSLKADTDDPVDVLSKFGGLDIAALAGLFIGAAYYRIPVIMDGLISAVGALIAYRLNPIVREYIIPSHISEEPAFLKITAHMGLEPILDLKMRLGEGTGCPLAMLIVDAALCIINEMLSFDESVLDAEKYLKKLDIKGGS